MTIEEREQALAQLKPRTQAVYRYMAAQLSIKGRVPTIRQVGKSLGMRSTNTTYYHLKKLAAVGLVERPYPQAWALKLPGITARPMYGKLEQVS